MTVSSGEGGSSSGGPVKKQRRLRRGWGFYWLWLRRLLLAKAVLSVVEGGLRSKMLTEHLYPESLDFVRL